jgi:hypothetical protein
MATEAARLKGKESTEAKTKTVLTHTGLLMEGLETDAGRFLSIMSHIFRRTYW